MIFLPRLLDVFYNYPENMEMASRCSMTVQWKNKKQPNNNTSLPYECDMANSDHVATDTLSFHQVDAVHQLPQVTWQTIDNLLSMCFPKGTLQGNDFASVCWLQHATRGSDEEIIAVLCIEWSSRFACYLICN